MFFFPHFNFVYYNPNTITSIKSFLFVSKNIYFIYLYLLIIIKIKILMRLKLSKKKKLMFLAKNFYQKKNKKIKRISLKLMFISQKIIFKYICLNKNNN